LFSASENRFHGLLFYQGIFVTTILAFDNLLVFSLTFVNNSLYHKVGIMFKMFYYCITDINKQILLLLWTGYGLYLGFLIISKLFSMMEPPIESGQLTLPSILLLT